MRKFLLELYHRLHLKTILYKLSFRLKIVDINRIRCQKGLEYSDYRGFGGKSIKEFPPYNIFKQKLIDHKKAEEEFYIFFYDNLINSSAFEVSKEQGGWYQGSLYKAINSIFKQKGIEINKNTIKNNKKLVEKAISKRINHYFNIFDSIQRNGYNPNLQPITAVKEKGLYYLINGHHRFAMLTVLNYDKILIFIRTRFKELLEKLSIIMK